MVSVKKLAMAVSISAVRGMLPAMGIGNLVVDVAVYVSVAVGTGLGLLPLDPITSEFSLQELRKG